MAKKSKECHCIIWHANTPAERAAAKDRLDQARQVGDTTGIMVALVALTGDCPARKKA